MAIAQLSLIFFVSILNSHFDCRTPFELNTSHRCAAIAVLHMLAVICTLAVIGMVVFLFIEFSTYTEACILDINSLLVRIDGLAGGKKSELQMIAYYKESVFLHERVNRYIFSTYSFVFVLNSLISTIVDLSDACSNFLVLRTI